MCVAPKVNISTLSVLIITQIHQLRIVKKKKQKPTWLRSHTILKHLTLQQARHAAQVNTFNAGLRTENSRRRRQALHERGQCKGVGRY